MPKVAVVAKRFTPCSSGACRRIQLRSPILLDPFCGTLDLRDAEEQEPRWVTQAGKPTPSCLPRIGETKDGASSRVKPHMGLS